MIAAYASAAWANLAPALGNHLWQSTWFAAIAGALALTMRKHEARVRYAVWLAASLKFLVPFSLLVSAGSHFAWLHATPARAARLSTVVQQASQPFVVEPGFSAAHATGGIPSGAFPALAFTVWLGGFIVILFAWWLRWRRISALVRASMPMQEGPETAALLDLQRRMRFRTPVALRSTATAIEPGIFGILRPVLLLPESITDRLAGAHLESVLAHELSHVRRRDNLSSAVHMLVEAIFWFHPLVWWIGARLIEERECACDEAVLKLGNDPEVYAESILQTCRYYLESPLPCVSGITGSDLKMRIVRIMGEGANKRLTLPRRLLLAAAGIAALSAPVVLGILHVPEGRAQTPPATPAPKFEVVSIKPSQEGGGLFRIGLQPSGRFVANNISVQFLMELAYGLKDAQISGAPRWVESEHFAIEAKPEDGFMDQKLSRDERSRQISLMMQSLLADRFKLAMHHETKEMPVYALVVAKSGSKLKEAPPAPPDGDMPPPGPPTGQMRRGGIRIGRGELTASAIPLDRLEDVLSRITARPVLNRTGLQGVYDFTLKWTPAEGEGPMMGGPGGPGGLMPPDAPPPPDANGPALFTAIEEQLGLKLESQKAPMDTVVIDHVERPSEN
jgi:bla regulator protein BlaR1